MVAHPGQRVVGPAGRPDDDVDARVDERVHVALGHRRDREVDGDLGARVGQDGEIVAGVDRGDELEVRCALDGADDGLSHAARRTQHGHPDAFAHGEKPYPSTSDPTALARAAAARPAPAR